jgi:hypothetical protein
LPGFMMDVLGRFAVAIAGQSTWATVESLVVGAILAASKRTVGAVQRVMGLGSERNDPK